MSSHLLSLAALHEADPRVLNVIFGADGAASAPTVRFVLTGHGDIPPWRGLVLRKLSAWFWVDSVRDGVVTFWDIAGPNKRFSHKLRIDDPDHVVLDLRVRSVAFRLFDLCMMAAHSARDMDGFVALSPARSTLRRLLEGGLEMPSSAAPLAELTLALAPDIAALGGAR